MLTCPESSSRLRRSAARPNQLFLTEVMNLDDAKAQGPSFRRTITWLTSTLRLIEPDAAFSPLGQAIVTDETFAEFAGRFLREAGTGIAGLEVQTTEIRRSDLPASVSGGDEMFCEGTGKEVVKYRRINALHNLGKEQPTRFALQEESDGSQRVLNLLPALHQLKKQGGVFVIDELERSMHPMLARKFIEFLLKAAHGTRSQLIFTTHESTLLDLDLMRRDGIWFAEKDQRGATQLYSLADFKVRKDLRLEKGYLEGRFGAIPFLGGIDQLLEEETTAEGKA